MSSRGASGSYTYMYTSECTVEIHSSSFGLTSFRVDVKGTHIKGLGSSVSKFSGKISGTIHYNHKSDLVGKQYRIQSLMSHGTLRIDFFLVQFPVDANPNSRSAQQAMNARSKSETPKAVFRGPCPADCQSMNTSFIGLCSFS